MNLLEGLSLYSGFTDERPLWARANKWFPSVWRCSIVRGCPLNVCCFRETQRVDTTQAIHKEPAHHKLYYIASQLRTNHFKFRLGASSKPHLEWHKCMHTSSNYTQINIWNHGTLSLLWWERKKINAMATGWFSRKQYLAYKRSNVIGWAEVIGLTVSGGGSTSRLNCETSNDKFIKLMENGILN